MLIGILCCILAGVANTLNRVLNARLVAKSGFYSAMTFSFFTGMVFAFFAYFATKSAFPIPEPLTKWQDNWVIIGVIPSIFTCLLFTLVAAKIPAFYHSVLICIGQVVTASILDSVLSKIDSIGFYIGSLLIICGIIWNVTVSQPDSNERKREKDAAKQ